MLSRQKPVAFVSSVLQCMSLCSAPLSMKFVYLRYNEMAILQVIGVYLILFNLPAKARMFIANFGIGVLMSCRPAYAKPSYLAEAQLGE